MVEIPTPSKSEKLLAFYSGANRSCRSPGRLSGQIRRPAQKRLDPPNPIFEDDAEESASRSNCGFFAGVGHLAYIGEHLDSVGANVQR